MQAVDEKALDTLFREARTYTKWQARPVPDETLRALYELLKWAPTSANSAPARFVFLRTPEAKERLRPTLAPLNIDKVMTAPVTVIIAYDLTFFAHLPKLFPQSPGMVKLFESNAEMVETTAKRNSSLQGAYMIMAARALGLDCGPMSGFDQQQGGPRVLFSREALLRLRSGVLRRRARQDELPVQPRLWRSELVVSATPTAVVCRRLFALVAINLELHTRSLHHESTTLCDRRRRHCRPRYRRAT